MTKNLEDNLKLLRKISPDQAWVAQTRAKLFDGFGGHFEPRILWKPALVFTFVITFLVGSTSFLAAKSLPGELLYPVKKSFEKVQLAMAKKEKKLDVQKKITSRKIEELATVVEKNHQAANVALIEVEDSVKQIGTEVNAKQEKLEQMEEAGENTEEIKQNLAEIVPEIETRQEELSKIQPQLPEERQDHLSTVIGDLEKIKLSIRVGKDDKKEKENEPEKPEVESTQPTTPTTEKVN